MKTFSKMVYPYIAWAFIMIVLRIWDKSLHVLFDIWKPVLIFLILAGMWLRRERFV